jgi:membrane fusion protein, copper/silver efflux system
MKSLFARHWGKLLTLVILLAGLGYLAATLNGRGLLRWPTQRDSAVAKADASPTIWTCPMHPQIVRHEPGRCPKCGMELVPVAKRSEETGNAATVPEHATVMIPGELQQRIGVRIGRVEKGPLDMSVEAMGIVRPDQTRMARVGIKTEGWIDKLFVNFVGQVVRKGDPLLSIYSPQFVSTQQELLTALGADRSVDAARPSLADAARRRLELWDVPVGEIDELQKSGKVQKDLVLRSPISGTVLEQNVYEKQYVTPEKELYVIGDLSTVWVQAQVYEYEIPHVELGRPATVTIPALPDQQFTGKVVFIQPTVEEATRTVQVRIELSNKEGIFKPGMFAQISIAHPMGEGLLAPTAAVLRAGDRDIVYRVEKGNHFVPVAVTISPIQFGDRYQILAGLKEGEQIVTSANFLIDSESRIQFSRGDAAGTHDGGHSHD